jgi:hypothetical protein
MVHHSHSAPARSEAHLRLNIALLRERIPNLTAAARGAGVRVATLSDLVNGRTPLAQARVGTLVILAALAGCTVDDLVKVEPPAETLTEARPDFQAMFDDWLSAAQELEGSYEVGPETTREDVQRSRRRGRRVANGGDVAERVGRYAV